jgi:hypothetical protein
MLFRQTVADKKRGASYVKFPSYALSCRYQILDDPCELIATLIATLVLFPVPVPVRALALALVQLVADQA